MNLQASITTVAFLTLYACALINPALSPHSVLAPVVIIWVISSRLIRKKNDRMHNIILKQSLSNILEQHNFPAFLTDETGKVLFSNHNAIIDLEIAQNKPIYHAFKSLFADPQALCCNLIERISILPSISETLTPQRDEYKFSLFKANDQLIVWFFESSIGGQQHEGYGHRLLNLPVMTISDQGKITFCNDACRKFLGRRPTEKVDVLGEKPIISGQTRRIKVQHGYQQFALVHIQTLNNSYDVILIPTSNDINDSLHITSDWDAIEDLSVPLMKISPSSEILAGNREARALLNTDEIKGKKISDLLDGLGRPLDYWIKETISGDDERVSQFLRGHGENQETFVQVTLNPSGSEDDRHIIAVLNDVTELKSLEAQFNQSQKMQAVGQLAGGIAHDFNNLLTAISGHCDLLLLRHNSEDHDFDDLTQISQNTNRAASLVGQLLAFSRKQTLQTEVVDLRDALSDMTHLLNRLVGATVQLNVYYSPDLSTIRADKRQLEQVVMNLVVNARDAMPEGGTIEIHTNNITYTQSTERERAYIPAGNYVSIRVIDEGHGISPEKMPKIFEPFFTTKRQGEGTGLGLSTAYGIVKQTGGYIFAKSELEKGTEFELIFPEFEYSGQEGLVEKTNEAKPQLPDIGSGVILIVEDEAPVRAFASRALNLRGYKVLEADCGEQALEILSDPNLHIDLFVTDVIMPGMDGPTWVNEALKTRPDTKVIFVSGYAEDAFLDSSTHIEHATFLPKPFSLKVLSETVNQQLEG